jgi:NAD(P)-dependent dehydrogenase (short-subunit alcohol dehydrogenase family)
MDKLNGRLARQEQNMSGWTARDIPDLAGRQVIVTGANSGLGFHTALQLAVHGAHVVLACRSRARGEDAAQIIRGRAPQARVEVAELDLADLASVRQFATAYSEAHGSLDVLVNNAGVMAIPRRRTVDGFEMQFGTNHLGHFALTALLLPALLTRQGARVVTVSSNAARIGKINFDDLQSEHKYGRWRAYGQSKLANLLFAFELDRRVRAAGLDLISVAAHPGYAATNLQAAGPRMEGKDLQARLAALGNRLFAQPASMGALPETYAAVASGVQGSEYFGPDRFFAQRGYPTRVKAPQAAYDTEVAGRLWAVSEQLTGVRFALNVRPDSAYA